MLSYKGARNLLIASAMRSTHLLLSNTEPINKFHSGPDDQNRQSVGSVRLNFDLSTRTRQLTATKGLSWKECMA